MGGRKKSVWRYFDYKTLIVVFLLFLFGLSSLLNATAPTLTGAETGIGDIIAIFDVTIVRNQLIWMAIGLALVLLIQFFNYSLFERYWLWIFIGSTIILILVLVFAKDIRGATRWLTIGKQGFQPSEFCKLSLIIVLASLLAKFDSVQNIREALPCIGIFIVFFVLVLLQKDLGTSLIYLGITLGMFFIAGMKLRYFAGMFATMAVVAVPFWFFVLEEHQKSRIYSFLNPTLENALQVNHSKTIIASGGIWGKG
ncbi:MAG TPA: FtsW/RodA/SpoVE family cell cycle protein, partial [Clostridia bacterium]|nr:FtsW/RodA/SpoVE family cell cycle protein [Clostridia bacterium]